MLPYEIRGAVLSDEDGLLDLAKHLDTVNLPNDRETIAHILDHANKSFTGSIKDPKRREYLFVLVETATGRLIGTSMIFGQLGRRDAPYIYLDVIDEERYSATLDRHFKHTTLSIGYSYNGPTEIGGLVVLPEYRLSTGRLGLSISYVRFMYMQMHRPWFRDEVLAELLPPLEPDGTSHLWDALGRHFTGMSYQDADFMSKRNKEFIRGLFPEGTIYASLLPKQAQDVIGKVGGQTRGVEKMLRRIGFRYAERVDPFDGGPHFSAPTDEITLVKRTTRVLVSEDFQPHGTRRHHRALVGIDLPVAPFFRAVTSDVQPTEVEGTFALPADTREHLGVKAGDAVWSLSLDEK